MARNKKSGSGGWRGGQFVAGIVLGLVLGLWGYPMFSEWWSQPSSGTPADNPSSSPTFDFYDILERGEEVVEETLASRPEPAGKPAAAEPAGGAPASESVTETVASTDTEPAAPQVTDTEPAPPAPDPVDTPGMYVLQMGAFVRQTEAESLKARLALVGMTARIQPVMVDRQTYYRVRIGPTDDLAQLNADRARLQQHRFDSILLKLVQ
ncbi:MAG: hypothetical protein F4109_12100 [Gammaproteobacteria bacterium]|nr:hypothetical protein [Gammaproteobacteria bacterium]MYD01471.1 hypothetical protein [Gammaproteobacteria bacterium]MYI26161.1 hypothetical protein [Gammaproteobacteria bacterium]